MIIVLQNGALQYMGVQGLVHYGIHELSLFGHCK